MTCGTELMSNGKKAQHSLKRMYSILGIVVNAKLHMFPNYHLICPASLQTVQDRPNEMPRLTAPARWGCIDSRPALSQIPYGWSPSLEPAAFIMVSVCLPPV